MISYNFLSLKENVLGWLEFLRVESANYGIYKFCEDGNPTLLSTCFAVFIRELLDNLGSLSDRERMEWIGYIKGSQDVNTGLFIDPLFSERDLGSKNSKEYVLRQTTMFCLSALNALGGQPDYALKLLDYYRNPSNVVNWLKRLDWSRPWLISNEIMFIMYFLMDDYEKNRCEESRMALDTIFGYLDREQDPKTGFWGTDKGETVFHGMLGAFHFYIFYFYDGHEIKYKQKIIDHTLALQHRDGLFSPSGGGGHCEDLDAIDILVKFSMVSNYRSADVKRALMSAFEGITRNQNPDGGFCYAKKYRYSAADWLDTLSLIKPRPCLDMRTRLHMLVRRSGEQVLYNKVRSWVWRYSSWKGMRCRINQSDIWSTWFRLLALALISSRYPEEFDANIIWRFRKNAGLGWHSNTIGEATFLKKFERFG